MMTPMKAIRAKCLDCCGNVNAVNQCPVPQCSLYPYRLGRNPKKPEYTEEQRAAMRERMQQLNLARKTR